MADGTFQCRTFLEFPVWWEPTHLPETRKGQGICSKSPWKGYTPPPASLTAPLPGSPSHPLVTGTAEPHVHQGHGKERQDAPTHVDLEDGGAHRGVLEEADVVQGLAKNRAVVVLIDEVNLHTREANVVWDTLVCEELGRDRKRRGGLEILFAKLGRVIYSSLMEKTTLS